ENAYDFSVNQPLRRDPGTVGNYNNCDPHVTGSIVKNTLDNMGEDILTWPQKAIYDKIGIQSMTMEVDGVGNPLSAAYAYATTRDWARLGQLYLQNGIWNGERLLSREYMGLVRGPAPTWSNSGVWERVPAYAGQVWLDGFDPNPNNPWPEDTYSMRGIEGQYVLIIPSQELVIVRLGYGAGDNPVTGVDNAEASLFEAGPVLFDALNHKVDKKSLEVEQTLRQFFDLLEKRDVDGLYKVTTDDFYLYEHGEYWSLDKLLKAIDDDVSNQWILTQMQTDRQGSLATIVYRNTGAFTNANGENEEYEWLESANFKRVDGTWKLSFLHSSRIE
ncbi:MAG: nuclear transport factor 2 family protein, partial [Pseudomonadota bacterium]